MRFIDLPCCESANARELGLPSAQIRAPTRPVTPSPLRSGFNGEQNPVAAWPTGDPSRPQFVRLTRRMHLVRAGYGVPKRAHRSLQAERHLQDEPVLGRSPRGFRGSVEPALSFAQRAIAWTTRSDRLRSRHEALPDCNSGRSRAPVRDRNWDRLRRNAALGSGIRVRWERSC